MSECILRLPVVLRRTGLSRSTLYSLQGQDDFPHSIALGARAVGWLESEVEAWISARIAAARRQG